MRRRRAAILSLLAVVVLGASAWLLFGVASRTEQDPPAAPPTSAPVTTAPTTDAATATTSAPGSTRPPPGSPAATVAEAEGWRLKATGPAAGSTVGRSFAVCYEVSGTSREPVLVLEAALARPGTDDTVEAERRDIPVGRGSVTFEFPAVAEGHYDLRVRLQADGRWIPGLLVAVKDVRVAAAAPPVSCG